MEGTVTCICCGYDFAAYNVDYDEMCESCSDAGCDGKSTCKDE